MKKIIFTLFLFLSLYVFSGDNCPSVISGEGGYDTYGTCAEWQASGAVNQMLYYDYKSPSTSLVDGTIAGCENFATIFAAGLTYCPAWALFLGPGLDWSNNNTCPTITGCDGRDGDSWLDGTDRMVLVVYTYVPGAGYSTKFVADTVAYNTTLKKYDFDSSIGSGTAGNPHHLRALPSPGISSAQCDGTNCNVVVTIQEPTFDPTGSTGGLYGDNNNVANKLIAGYKVFAVQSSSAPTSPAKSSWNISITDTDRFIPATQPPNGGTLTSNTITIPVSGTNNLYIAYAPIFNYLNSGCWGSTCSTAQLQALDAISTSGSLTLPVVSAASLPIKPTPVTITSFTARYVDLQNVKIDWETASETDALGFYLYRSTDRQNWVQVNSQIILAKGQGGAGATYTYNDTVPKQRTYTKYYYKVEEISNNGQRIAQAETETTK